MKKAKSKAEEPVKLELDYAPKPTHHFTRLFKKRMAPAGSIFLIVTVKDFKMAYQMSALVSFDFTKNEDSVKELVDQMIVGLKTKYKL